MSASVSASTISLIERGLGARVTLHALRAVGGALGGSIDITFRWHGGDLERLVNARHAALNEVLAASFARLREWQYSPEVSFSIYGERGVIDALAWHPGLRALLVVELKTEIVDVNELLGTLDRKRRLAGRIARDRGWRPESVSVWLAIADTRTNRRRVAAHAFLLRSVFNVGPKAMRSYLRDPSQPVAALTFVTDCSQARLRHAAGAVKRVRRPRVARDRRQTSTTSGNSLPQAGPTPAPNRDSRA